MVGIREVRRVVKMDMCWVLYVEDEVIRLRLRFLVSLRVLL